MGSTTSEPGRYDNDNAQHIVVFARPLRLRLARERQRLRARQAAGHQRHVAESGRCRPAFRNDGARDSGMMSPGGSEMMPPTCPK